MNGGNIIIGNCSGNVGNSNARIISEVDDPPCQPSPMGNTIHYTNIEVHIGLFGNSNIFDVNRIHFRPSASRFTAFLCAWVLIVTLASSTPTASRRELSESIEWAELANCSSEYLLKDKRRKIV